MPFKRIIGSKSTNLEGMCLWPEDWFSKWQEWIELAWSHAAAVKQPFKTTYPIHLHFSLPI